jgi:hypothetical protein
MAREAGHVAASLVIGNGNSCAGRCRHTNTTCDVAQQPGQALLLPRSTGATAVAAAPRASIFSQLTADYKVQLSYKHGKELVNYIRRRQRKVPYYEP